MEQLQGNKFPPPPGGTLHNCPPPPPKDATVSRLVLLSVILQNGGQSGPTFNHCIGEGTQAGVAL